MILEMLNSNPSAGIESPATNIWTALEEAYMDETRTEAGVLVSESGSENALDVMTCVRIRSETLANLPFGVFRKRGNSREQLDDHQLALILGSEANPHTSAFVLLETLASDLDRWGNCYAYREYDNAGRLTSLRHIPAGACRPEIINGEWFYLVTVGGKIEPVLPSEIFHVSAFRPSGGLRGISPVRVAASAIGLSKAMDVFASRFFGAGAFMGGFVTHPGKLSEPAADRLRKSLEKMHSGVHRSHRFAVLDEGMTFNGSTMPLEETQLLAARAFTRSQIAAFYRISPDRVGIFEKAATFASLDATEVRHVKDAIVPLVTRFEKEINRQLLGLGTGLYAKFNLSSALRGEEKARAEVQSIRLQNGILSPDEVRAQEDLDPRSDGFGGIWYIPENQRPATLPYPVSRGGEVGAAAQQVSDENDGADDDSNRQNDRDAAVVLRPVIVEVARRLHSREAVGVQRMVKAAGAPEDITGIVSRYYAEADHSDTAAELAPIVQSAAIISGLRPAEDAAEQIAAGYLSMCRSRAASISYLQTDKESEAEIGARYLAAQLRFHLYAEATKC